MVRGKLADEIAATAAGKPDLFQGLIKEIQEQLQYFRTVEQPTGDEFTVGFFDDVLHLTGEFMMSGVCTYDDRARQVREGAQEGYHFGTIALKGSDARVHGISQVQVLKTGVQNLSDNKTTHEQINVYRVIALTGLNLSPKVPISERHAVLSILKTALNLQKAAGLQAAVIPANETIYSNQPVVHSIIKSLVEAGHLERRRLDDPVALSKGPHKYSYQDVYVIKSVPEMDDLHEQKQKQYEYFLNGLGHIPYNGELAKTAAEQLAARLDALANEFPNGIRKAFENELHSFSLQLNFVYSPDIESSYVDYSPEGDVVAYFGHDIFDGVRFHENELSNLLASAVAFVSMREEYRRLSSQSSTNENAFWKLEVLKALIAYPRRFEALQSQQQNLEAATRGMSNIDSWMLFLNVMNDADPHLVLKNYLHLLSTAPSLQTPAEGRSRILEHLISIAEQTDVSGMISFAHLRNIEKEFLLDGIARVPVAGQMRMKDRYDYFDDSQRLHEWKELLRLTQDVGEFYSTLQILITYTLPLDQKSVTAALRPMMNEQVDRMNGDQREAAVRELLEHLIRDHLGDAAADTLQNHMMGMRGTEDIPYFALKVSERQDDSYDRARDLFPMPTLPPDSRGDEPALHQSSIAFGLTLLFTGKLAAFFPFGSPNATFLDPVLVISGIVALGYGLFYNLHHFHLPSVRAPNYSHRSLGAA
jgi:hypothetical protein